MTMNRRDMLTSAGAFALLAAEIDTRAFAEAIQEAPHSHAVDVSDYWSSFYDDAIGTQSRGPKGLAMHNRQTLYLHCPDSLGTLNYADNLSPKSLPAIKGDVLVKLAVSQYRPGNGDASTDVSHLRVDATQSFDSMNLVAPLSWAAIAAFTPSNQVAKLPTIDSLGFSASANKNTALNQITLPSGVGKFAVNITRPANPTFIKIFQSASAGITSVLSMMTLPAISVPAIKVFSELFGKWQEKATVVMNGNLTPVIATSTPSASIEVAQDPMPLMNGYYVMYPKEHQDELSKEFPNLTVQNGFLVHKDAPASDNLETRAKNAVPGVSYATLRLYASAAAAAGCAAKPEPTSKA